MLPRTVTVRVARELLEPLDRLVEELKDEYGMPVFKSKTDAVTRAVKDLLEEYSKEETKA